MSQLSENSVSNTVDKGQISPTCNKERVVYSLKGREGTIILSSFFTNLVKGGKQRE